MNNVVLCGRLARDVEKANDIAYKTCIAVDRPSKDGKKATDFISLTAFGKTGDVMMTHFGKGKPIIVYGNIKTGSYENKDGKKVFTFEVYVDRVEFVPRDSQAEKSDGTEPPKSKDYAKEEDTFDDIPF